MAIFGIRIKKRRQKALGGFHAEYLNKRDHASKKKIGFFRSLGSAASLILGGAMFYIALHYIPAYLGLQKIVAFSKLDNSASRLAKDNPSSILSAYIDPFRLKRTYLRQGQSIQVQYALPEGAELKILVNQCKAAFIVEIFKCNVISQETSFVKNDRVGTLKFKFQDAGFYVFDEIITQTKTPHESFRVVWSRT